MARKKATLTRRQKSKQRFHLDPIQWAGIGVIVVLAAAAIWYFARPSQSTAQAPSPSTKQWTSAPPMTIDTSKKYFATVKMAKGGEFVMQLYPDKAPVTVNSFVFLARQGFFNGATFHRVIDGFMAQGGDPTGTGMGGSGKKLEQEFSRVAKHVRGTCAMAR